METSKTTSLTKNASNNKKNPSPLKTNAKQGKDGKDFRNEGIEDSSNTRGALPNKTSMGGQTNIRHNKATGGHPEHRASEFSGKGRGFMTKMG